MNVLWNVLISSLMVGVSEEVGLLLSGTLLVAVSIMVYFLRKHNRRKSEEQK
jgi:uncharacterized membrane protein YqhA